MRPFSYSPVLASLPDEDLDRLFARAVERRLEPDDILHFAGEVEDRVHLVTGGVIKHSVSGAVETIVGLSVEGDLVGEVALMEDNREPFDSHRRYRDASDRDRQRGPRTHGQGTSIGMSRARRFVRHADALDGDRRQRPERNARHRALGGTAPGPGGATRPDERRGDRPGAAARGEGSGSSRGDVA